MYFSDGYTPSEKYFSDGICIFLWVFAHTEVFRFLVVSEVYVIQPRMPELYTHVSSMTLTLNQVCIKNLVAMVSSRTSSGRLTVASFGNSRSIVILSHQQVNS